VFYFTCNHSITHETEEPRIYYIREWASLAADQELGIVRGTEYSDLSLFG